MATSKLSLVLCQCFFFHFSPRNDVTRLLLSTDYLDNLDYPPTIVMTSLFLIASIGHLSRFNDPVDNRPSQRTLLLRKIIWFSRIRNLDCFYPAIHKASFFFKAFPYWHFPVSIFVSLWMSAADGMVCAIKLTSIQVFIMSGKTDIWWEFFSPITKQGIFHLGSVANLLYQGALLVIGLYPWKYFKSIFFTLDFWH